MKHDMDWLQQVFDGLYERFERDGVFDEAAAKQAILSHIQQVEVEARIDELEKFHKDFVTYGHMNGDWGWELKERLAQLAAAKQPKEEKSE